MGYEIGRVRSEVAEEFICSICLMILEDPRQTSCEHTFCNSCIHSWLEIKETCPVDTCPLTPNQIKETPRYFRNMLGKVEVKCKFERGGCPTIVRLDELPHHLTKCLINPDAEITCDKGCNIKITRREYEIADCDTHRASEQQNEIRWNEQIDVNDQNPTLHWQIFEKLTTMPVDQSRILECDRSGVRAIAQTEFSLQPGHAIFGINVLRMHKGNEIAIGLTPTGQPNGMIPGLKGIGYWNSGSLFYKKIKKPCGAKWRNGDIITCAVLFPQDFTNDGNTMVEICFAVNGQIVIRQEMVYPLSGLSPTVYMCRAHNWYTIPKVEFL